MSTAARPFHLDKPHGRLLGVCAGLADYTRTDATIVRLLVVLVTLFALGPLMLLAYGAVALVATDRPR